MSNRHFFYSRSNNVEKDYIIKQVDLSEIVNRVLRNNAPHLIEQKIGIETAELEQTVLTDSKWTDFILQQLIDNAVKYGCTKLKFYSEQNPNGVSLFVCDNGIGIPPQDIGRVFDKGFTGENGRTHGRSTGIGLYLCKKLCVKLGLDISVQSQDKNTRRVVCEDTDIGTTVKEGSGTTIQIVFPKSDMNFGVT